MSTATRQASRNKAQSDPRTTPAMRQYYAFKEQHPECVLFFRMGDFYEMFDDDAVLCHKVLGITLTERTKGVPMAGVPYHAVDGYLSRMIALGYRVAVCEQVEDPAEAKGVVKRAVTRVLTPGTLVDESLLDESRTNQIAAIQFTEPGDDSPAVVAVAELSTGAFTLWEIPGGRVVDEMARLAPSELIFVETANGEHPPRVARIREQLGCALTARPAWTFRLGDAGQFVRDAYGVRTLNGFGLDDDDPAIGPAGALLRYLHETQPEIVTERSGDRTEESERDQGRPVPALCAPHREAVEDHLIIDATSLRALEIERTMRTGQVESSLLDTLQRARSAMGKRLLRQWLCYPIRDIEEITRRQRCVAAMVEDRPLRDALGEVIGSIQDVARVCGRLAMRRTTPRDLVALGRSVALVKDLARLVDGRPAFTRAHERLQALSASLTPLAERIQMTCIETPPAHMRDGGLIRDGVDRQLDEARTLQRDANSWLAEYQRRLTKETGIPSLKVGYNRVFGYYIEITHAHAGKAPDSFMRKQTLKNAERYITPELKEFEDKVTTAESRAIEREQTLFDRLCRDAARHVDALRDFANTIAELDVLLCFADNAVRFGYVQPTVLDEPGLSITQGRHPVLDRTLSDGFVPNDCVLGRHAGMHEADDDDATDTAPDSELPQQGAAALALITGPNMAGKSTYIRQVALIVLLAHTGSFVPAESATIGRTDRIFTRIGASDELHAGQSTFMVEMTETANILHHATDRSLVILDEIGRGTSTLDGLALAWAIAESLADIGCRTLFATHYHELTALADRLDRVRNLHVAVREWGDDVIFLYRILPGRTDRSYGIHVARIAGLPSATVARARSLLETLTVQTEHTQNVMPVSEVEQESAARSRQLDLFTEYVEHPVVEKLREMNLDAMSPMEAFDRLRGLRSRLES